MSILWLEFDIITSSDIVQIPRG